MKHINTFNGGVDRDTAETLMEPSRPRAATNFRLENVEGQGFIFTNVKGNELAFAMSSGFVPLGYAEYNGIAFIFSVNTSTGVGEVGTYPSPKLDCLGGFDHLYRPLQNWTANLDPRDPLAVRQHWRTTRFNFDCSRQLEVEARISYDNSVELFFADWRNPLRHLNTGFDITTGICNNRNYWEGSFPNSLNVFFESCGHPIHTDVRLDNGGGWQAGNVFLYYQYETLDFNTTSFLGETGPIQLTQDDLTTGAGLDGDAGLTNTGKAIEVDLSNIDSTFPYLRVAFSYHHTDTVLTGLISTRFTIPLGATTMTIRLTGLETVIDMTAAEIIRRKVDADVPRTITQQENRLFGGNWKERDIDYEALRLFALSIKVKPRPAADLVRLDDARPYTSQAALATPYQYKDYRNTLNSVGYFRTESYPFAMVFVFADGRETLPYPVTGHDAWFDPGITTPNNRGILRMPSNTQAGYEMYRIDTGTWTVRALGVIFDTTGIVIPQYILDNCCGFYFVRGERKPNLLYQGLISDAYLPSNIAAFQNLLDPTPCCDFSPATQDQVVTVHHLAEVGFRQGPLSNWYPPVEVHQCDNGNPGNILLTTLIPGFVIKVANRHGFFSSDHFFDPELTDGLYTLILQGYAQLSQFDLQQLDYVNARMYDQTDFNQAVGLVKGKAQLYNIAPRNTNTVAGFTSRFIRGDDTTQGLPIQFYAWWECPFLSGFDRDEVGNRDLSQRQHIGIDFTAPGAVAIPIGDDPAITPLGPAVVNIYRTDPDPGAGYDITTLYDPGQTIYYKISSFIPIADFGTLPTRAFHRGDCFVQRTYHKQVRDDGNQPYPNAVGNKFYAHGTLLGLVQEQRHNSAMRFEVGATGADPTYYPERQPFNPTNFAVQISNGVDESDLLNHGYDVTLSIRGILGDDIFTPFRGLRFPVRVRFSHTYINDRFTDGYLNWDFDGKKDYDHRMGEIVKLKSEDSLLWMVQEGGINRLIVNDRVAMTSATSAAELVVGQGETLSQNYVCVTDKVGSQHQFSVIGTMRGLYGWDMNKRVVWRASGQGFESLSDILRFRTDVVAMSQVLSDHSDILHNYPDAPVCLGGIVAFYDRKHHEVGWTVRVPSVGLPRVFMEDTIALNELYGTYSHRRTHNTAFYISINEDFFSCDPAGLPGGTGPLVPRFFLHDVDSVPRANFYGFQHEQRASVIANPNPSQPNVFDAMDIGTTDVVLARVRWTTEYQLCLSDPFLTLEHWSRPVFKEYRWHMPILRATAVSGTGVQDQQIGSRMRGRYIRGDMEWDGGGVVDLNHVGWKFRPSFQ